MKPFTPIRATDALIGDEEQTGKMRKSKERNRKRDGHIKIRKYIGTAHALTRLGPSV